MASDHVRVRTTSAITLRDSLSGPLGQRMCRRGTISIDSWESPYPGWTARLGPIPGLLRYDVRRGDPSVTVRVTLARPVPFALVAGAVLSALVPDTRLPAPVTADVAAYDPLPAWLPPAANVAGLVGPAPAEDVIRPYDVLLTTGARSSSPRTPSATPRSGTPPASGGAAAAASGGGAGAASGGGAGAASGGGAGAASGGGAGAADGARTVRMRPWGVGAVLVDATYVNPRGYSFADGVGGTLHVESDGWRISTPQRVVCDGVLPMRLLDEYQLGEARAVRSVVAKHLPGRDPGAEAFLIAQLAMSGIVVLAEQLPGPTAQLLAAELVRIIAAAPPATPMEFRARSVVQRRIALRHHATTFALPSVLDALPAEMRLPTVSAVLTSPDEAVISMLAAQTYPLLEILVGSSASASASASSSSASSASSGAAGAVGSPGSVAASGEVLGFAVRRVAGDTFAEVAAQARGSLVTRIDPDSAYGPEHVWDLVLARHYSGATVVGKAGEFHREEFPDLVAHVPAGRSETYTPDLSPGARLVARSDLSLLWTDPLPPGVVSYRTHPYAFALPPLHPSEVDDPALPPTATLRSASPPLSPPATRTDVTHVDATLAGLT